MGWKDVLKRFTGGDDVNEPKQEEVPVLPGQEVLPGMTPLMGLEATTGADHTDDLAAIVARDAAAKPERAAFDAYPTPVAFAEGMARRVAEILPYPPAAIIEPSAGAGAFVRAAHGLWPTVPIIAVEVQPGLDLPLYEAGAEGVSIANWIDVAEAINRTSPALPPPPWLVIGNPPYLEAVEHIEAALRVMQHGEWLAFLLRINFFGSNGRRAFWARKKDRLRYLIPFTQRPKFRNNKSDATEYGCFIWQKGWTGNAEILPNMDIAEELVREKEE